MPVLSIGDTVKLTAEAVRVLKSSEPRNITAIIQKLEERNVGNPLAHLDRSLATFKDSITIDVKWIEAVTPAIIFEL